MTDQLVLVTGASGYIACHVIKQLQSEGYRVRGTVRSLASEDKVVPLKNLVPDAKHPLELVEANLTSDDGWDKAVEGCYAVMHTASPFPNVIEKKVTQEDLVQPAKEGTLRVLKAASEAGVKKLVLTSSFASVFAEAVPEPGKKYSEEDWTNPESSEVDVYSKSKVLAEKAAWDYLKELPEDKKFEMAVINPVFVMGPPLMEAHKSSTSVSFLIDILTHKNPAVLKFMIGYCDVRDVAKAHVLALTKPEAAGKRHIICTKPMWMKDVANIMADEFRPQGYKIATMAAPNCIVWLGSFFSEPLKGVVPKLGKAHEVDNSRMVNVLEITPTPIEETLYDMAYALIDMNLVPKSKKYKQAGSRAEVPAAPAVAAEQQPETTEQQPENTEQQPENTEQKPEPDNKDKELEPEDKEKSKEAVINNENQSEEVKSS